MHETLDFMIYKNKESTKSKKDKMEKMEEVNIKLTTANANLIKDKKTNIDVLKVYESKDKKIKELNDRIKLLLQQNEELKNDIKSIENRFGNKSKKNKGINTCAFTNKKIDKIPI